MLTRRNILEALIFPVTTAHIQGQHFRRKAGDFLKTQYDSWFDILVSAGPGQSRVLRYEIEALGDPTEIGVFIQDDGFRMIDFEPVTPRFLVHFL